MRLNTMFVLGAALCSASLYAQGPKTTHWTGPAHQSVEPAEVQPATLQKLFSNLGSSTDAYYADSGWTLSGPESTDGFTQFVALPFTVASNAHVKKMVAAATYNASGANQVNLSLYDDANGAPGTLIAGPVTVTNLESFGGCCKLAIATFSTAVAITGGAQYWVVADTPNTGTGSDFSGVWNFVALPNDFFGINLGAGWNSYQASTSEPAGAVYGSIP
jgi:hypothetical protein